jgi:hypothetical protein
MQRGRFSHAMNKKLRKKMRMSGYQIQPATPAKIAGNPPEGTIGVFGGCRFPCAESAWEISAHT